jgi:hypothetical protein
MALISIYQLPRDDQLTAMLQGLVAIDLESGARLCKSHGRTSKAPKYILVLPNKSIEERGGLFAHYEWDYPHGRKFVRSWGTSTAIELANVKLAKMLKEQKKLAKVLKEKQI